MLLTSCAECGPSGLKDSPLVPSLFYTHPLLVGWFEGSPGARPGLRTLVLVSTVCSKGFESRGSGEETSAGTKAVSVDPPSLHVPEKLQHIVFLSDDTQVG